MYEARVTQEGAQQILHLNDPDGRITRIPLQEDLCAAGAQLKEALGKAHVAAIALPRIEMAAGFALGLWAPGHTWRWSGDSTFAALKDGLLSVQGANFPTVTIALPASVEEAAPLLRGVIRTWPEAAAGEKFAIDQAEIAGGILLGMVLGEHDPELLDLAQVSGPPPQKGPMPDELLERLEPIRRDIIRKLRFGTAIDVLIQELQASPAPGLPCAQHPRPGYAGYAHARLAGRPGGRVGLEGQRLAHFPRQCLVAKRARAGALDHPPAAPGGYDATAGVH